MKTLNKIIEIILNIIIFLVFIVIIIGGLYVIQTKIKHKSYANIFGYTGFEVITGSMSGTIEIGDVVIVKITSEIQENEIIVYKQDDDFITHRIISINGDKITTKGDSNNCKDKEIESNQVLGKVIMVIPQIAIWRKVLSTPAVFISIISAIILFGLAFSYDGENSKKERKNDKQKKT